MTTENQQVTVNDQNADAVVQIPNIPESGATAEQVAELKIAVATLSGQKKHWRDKAVDPETQKPWAEIARERAPQTVVIDKPNQAPPAMAQLEKDVQGLKAVEEKRLFGHQHGLSPEATDKVFSYAQGNAMKPEDALKDDFVKSGLSSLQARERLSRNVPGPSHRAASVGGKSFAEMKPDERRANFAKVTGAER